MGFVPVADTVQFELFQRMHGQRVENVLYFRLVGGFGTAEVTDLWNKLLVWWPTQLGLVLSNNLTLVGGKGTDLSTATSFAMEFNAPTPNPAGTVGSPALPGNAALCVSIRTLGRGRSSRGRNFIAGLSEASVTGNTVDSAVISGIQDAYNGLRALAFSDPWEHVVVSRQTGGADRVAGLSQVVTNCQVVDPFIDSMRSRLTGRGL